MADVLAIRDDYRLQTWAQTVQACRNSGMTNRAFCRQQGIPEKTYYYWLRKLRNAAAETSQPKLVQLEPDAVKTVKTRDETLEIQFRGASLSIPGNVDIATVAEILRTLQKL